MTGGNGALELAGLLAIGMLSAGLALCVLRLVQGPSTPDRVVALDLAALMTVGIITVYAIVTAEPSLLAIGLVVGLVAFLGAVAFARYLERRAR